jgi:hypothetical protein
VAACYGSSWFRINLSPGKLAEIARFSKLLISALLMATLFSVHWFKISINPMGVLSKRAIIILQ